MKFKEFFAETLSETGKHKHLSLSRAYDLRLAVDAEFRQKLQSYPEATDESVNDFIQDLVGRYEEKWMLMRERGLSNSSAENFLDRAGHSRPPGWHSVFFYPDSMMPRKIYVALLIGIAVILSMVM